MLTWWSMLKQVPGSLVLWWLSSTNAQNLRSKLAKIHRRREATNEKPNWLHRSKSLQYLLCQGLHIFSMWFGHRSFSFSINRTKWDTHRKTGKSRHCTLHYSIHQESYFQIDFPQSNTAKLILQTPDNSYVVPGSMEKLVMYLEQRYKSIPLYITENGGLLGLVKSTY